jgi:predicted metal-binding membrane protein
MSLITYYTSFRGLAINLRVGVHHGIYCVGCCWGLMLILVAVGVMNIPAMAALTIVIFTEKLLLHGLFHSAAHRYFFLRCISRCADFSQPLSRPAGVLH